MLKFDRAKMELSYIYAAQDKQGHIDKYFGYSALTFYHTAEAVDDGQGFCVDCHEEPYRWDFSFSRVKPSLIRQLLGHEEALTWEMREEFIKRYHKAVRQ